MKPTKMVKRHYNLLLLTLSLLYLISFIKANQLQNTKKIKTEVKSSSRNLEDSSNYVVLTFNQEFSFEIKDDKGDGQPFFINNISYIYYQNEDLNKTSTDTLNVSDGTILEIHFNTSITNCQGFFWCINNDILDKISSIDLSHFDFSQVTDMYTMMAECTQLKYVDLSNVNAPEVTEIGEIFKNCATLETINLSNINMPKLINLNGAFQECYSLKYVDLTSLDTTNVEDMSNLFFNSTSLESVDLSKFSTSKVLVMRSMFYNCYSLKSIDLSNFDTNQVKDMSYMFKNCSSLTSLDLSNFKTNEVGGFEGMFEDCTSLLYLNLSSFNTSLSGSMSRLFGNCICLKILDISNFDTTKFEDCSFVIDFLTGVEKLKYVNLLNVKDNCLISDSSINEIDNLQICQKNEIITNPSAKNICTGYDFNIETLTCDDIIISSSGDLGNSDILPQDEMTSYPNIVSDSSDIPSNEDDNEGSTNNQISFSSFLDYSSTYNEEISENVLASSQISLVSSDTQFLDTSEYSSSKLETTNPNYLTDNTDTSMDSDSQPDISNTSSQLETTNPNYLTDNTDEITSTSMTDNSQSDIPSETESVKIPKYTIESINQEDCDTTGVLSFSGKSTESISYPITFTIPLLNPKGVTLYCILEGNEIVCEVDRVISGNILIFNETTIKDDNDQDVLILESFFSDEGVSCSNAYLMKAVKKLFVDIAFRQVSHFQKNDQANSFSFYLITLVSEVIKKGHELNVKMDLIINNDIVEKNATCILEKDVSPNSGELAQGNFVCSVILTTSEYQSTDFENIRISLENDEITGTSDLDATTSNPYKTDQAIAEIRKKKANKEAINELAYIVDYYEEEIKIPPFFNIDSVNIDECNTKGKLIFNGSFSDDVNYSIKFDLLLTYPLTEFKCELPGGKKDEQIEITCKAHVGFELVEALIIEQKMIKKKNKEIFIIKKKEIDFDENKECLDYYTVKTIQVRKRQQSNFSFLQLSKFTPRLNSLAFFFALTRKTTSISFKTIIQFSVKIRISNRRLLRNLDQTSSGVKVDCNINSTLQTELAAGYNCANSDTIDGTPLSMELETSDIDDIQGIPENANPDKLTNKIDYSTLLNLKSIDNLPNLVVDNINGDTCFTNGRYKVNGTLDKNENLEENYSNITLRMALPESNGFCEVNIKDKNVEMICENSEKFYMSKIFIERHAIQDSEGKEIFFIDNFESSNEIACDISLYSPQTNSSLEPTDDDNSNYSPNMGYFNRKTKGGLSGGAIAGIIISVAAVVAILTVLVVLRKKGKIFTKNALNGVEDPNSSISQFRTGNKM